MQINAHEMETIIRRALDEDIGTGDLTTSLLLDGDEEGRAKIFAKNEPIVVAGLEVCKNTFMLLDPGISFVAMRDDGALLKKGDVAARVEGRLSSIITAERVALNFLQRLSGIATLTWKYNEEIKGTGAKLLDTRKTTPGLRVLEKYAVSVGGGVNHRFGLFDAVMIKDNHIHAAGGIRNAMKRLSTNKVAMTGRKVEIEVTSLQEIHEVLSSEGAVDVIMLDNMNLDVMREAVRMINGKTAVEASGNVTLANIRAIAETGVNFISVGALTHSAPAADLSLLIE